MLVRYVSPAANKPESWAVGQPLVTLVTLTADLRYRFQGVWREAQSVDPRENINKCATYQAPTPHVLLCGDFSAKVGRMSEDLDMHDGLLMAHPALQQARRCECSATNAAGRQLVELSNVSSCILGMGRVLGDNGQRTCVGHARGQGGSGPDHVVMSDKVFRIAEQVKIAEVPQNPEHVCKPGGCGSRLVLNWRPECAEAYAQRKEDALYADALVRTSEMQAQFKQAIAKEDPVSACAMACFCLRSMIVQAAGDVGMAGLVSVCGPLRASRRGTHSPP
eukprot:1146230-Pelagomonas_calceolata.AAC.1